MSMRMLSRVTWTLIKNHFELGALNDLVYEDLMLSINTKFSVRQVAFGLLRNAKCLKFLKGNCKVAQDRLIDKYALQVASYILKLKSKVHNSKLESTRKWFSNLEGLQIQMNWFRLRGINSNKIFIICIINTFPEEYDIILNRHQNHLITSDNHSLTIEVIREKLNHRCQNIKNKNEEKIKRKVISSLWKTV